MVFTLLNFFKGITFVVNSPRTKNLHIMTVQRHPSHTVYAAYSRNAPNIVHVSFCSVHSYQLWCISSIYLLQTYRLIYTSPVNLMCSHHVESIACIQFILISNNLLDMDVCLQWAWAWAWAWAWEWEREWELVVRLSSEKTLGHNIRDLPYYLPAQKGLTSLISRAYNTKTSHRAFVSVTDIDKPLKDMNVVSWKKVTGLRLAPVTYPEHPQSLCISSPSTGQGKSIFMDVIYWHLNPHLEH